MAPLATACPVRTRRALTRSTTTPDSPSAPLIVRRCAMQLRTSDGLIARCSGGRASVRASLSTNALSVTSCEDAGSDARPPVTSARLTPAAQPNSDSALNVAYHGVGIALVVTGIGAVARAIGRGAGRAGKAAANFVRYVYTRLIFSCLGSCTCYFNSGRNMEPT